ncbi:MAG TPA: ABC transporter ATP-binding protein, partial [Lachnospiraceae bacterium]|nr:ABC transporter ATP-binding protein [Lachnospiraceae bacterium]
MRTPLLTIRDLDVWYQSEKPVLSKFSLTLKKGEVVGLIGL